MSICPSPLILPSLYDYLYYIYIYTICTYTITLIHSNKATVINTADGCAVAAMSLPIPPHAKIPPPPNSNTSPNARSNSSGSSSSSSSGGYVAPTWGDLDRIKPDRKVSRPSPIAAHYTYICHHHHLAHIYASIHIYTTNYYYMYICTYI
jgi:hypothetical protein